jgi:hypothetical protein
MIRSRSYNPYATTGSPPIGSSSPVTVPSSPERTTFSRTLWRMLCIVLAGGVIVYFVIPNKVPTDRKISSRLSERVTVVINTFKRNDMMQGNSYIYGHICIHIYACIHINMYTYMYIRMHVYMSYTSPYLYVCLSVSSVHMYLYAILHMIKYIRKLLSIFEYTHRSVKAYQHL